jgi:transposase
MNKTVHQKKVTRRKYDEEFKASTLRLVSSGRSVADVARSLGVNENLIHKWKSAAESKGNSGSVGDEEKENMRRYIKQLETERDILKKALSIFSRTP